MARSSEALLFAALGDETRLKLVARLSDRGPMSITGLADGSGVTRQAIAKHLRLMEEAKLVRCKRRGREAIWQLDNKRVAEARRYLKLISEQWDDALNRLRESAESSIRQY